MLRLVSRHRVFVVYLLSLGWLAVSALTFAMFAHRGGDHAIWVVFVLAGVTLVYVGAWRLAERVWPAWTRPSAASVLTPTPFQRALLGGLVAVYALVVTLHFSMIGCVPIIEALGGASERDVSIVRQSGYFDLPGLMRYASDYSTKALGPALLLVTYYFRSRLFWVVLAIGVFYTTGLIARILPIMLLLPLLVFMVTQRRWLHIALVVALLGVQLSLSTVVASPVIKEALSLPPMADVLLAAGADRPQVDLKPLPERPHDWRRTSIVYSFYDRMLLVPGQVMAQWFEYYAERDRREGGCGYRVVAGLIGCSSYVPIPSKLYAAFYQENVAYGMRGSLNAASFMTEFANFGPAGFVLSALLGGLLFATVAFIYRDHPLALPMNLPLIVITMETSLPTAVNSGSGWLVMTLIFILLFRLPRK